MGKTRDLFFLKKISYTKGNFQAKMGSIKDRNGMDLIGAEDIKKRWQEYTEELYKKDFHYSDNYDGVITHLEPDILECEVKWALGRKVSQSCPTLCDPVDCSLPGSSVHGTLQARNWSGLPCHSPALINLS